MGSTKMEVLAIIIAGLIPIGLAIHNVLKADKSEKELKDQQEVLIATQRNLIDKQEELNKQQVKNSEEIKEKSDKIIELQDDLAKKSEDQIERLVKLASPIPKEASINFESTLVITDEDYDDLINDITTSGVKTGNLLPTKFITSKPIIDKINLFKDIHCRITIVLTNARNKTLSLSRDIVPTLTGFNAVNTLDCFTLSYNRPLGKFIYLSSIGLNTNVDFNYDQASLLDFKNSNAEIFIEFSTPKLFQFGSQIQKKYVSNTNLMKLTLKNLTINFKGYKSIQLKDFTETENNKFQAKLSSGTI
jgi:hypothetical protein